MNQNIVDTATNEVIGTVVTNHSMTFDQIMEIAGFEYVEGNETGWSKDGGRTVYTEETAKIVEKMNKIIINIHSDFLGTEADEQYIAKYQKRATEILSAEWDVIEFENVIAQKSWRYEAEETISDEVGFWTQESLERAYQEAEA